LGLTLYRGGNRKRAGNRRFNSLKVSHVAFYSGVATSVSRNFEPLTDTVNNDGSEVTGIEWLQMIYRQAKALGKANADLDAVDRRVTVTYVYDGHFLVVAPTTFNFVDNAINAKGTTLHSHFGVRGADDSPNPRAWKTKKGTRPHNHQFDLIK
jgi:hypothetical protein